MNGLLGLMMKSENGLTNKINDNKKRLIFIKRFFLSGTIYLLKAPLIDSNVAVRSL